VGEAARPIESTGQNKGLANLRPWQPGQSGNPGGRPKGLISYIREKTLDGRLLADFLLEVVQGNERAFCKMSDRLKATEMLLDRGCFPKTHGETDPDAKPILDLSKLTEQELQFLDNVRLGLIAISSRIGSGEAEAEPK
jgi:hypothetical protein